MPSQISGSHNSALNNKTLFSVHEEDKVLGNSTVNMGSVVPGINQATFVKTVLPNSAHKRSPQLAQVEEDRDDGMDEISKQLKEIKPRYSPKKEKYRPQTSKPRSGSRDLTKKDRAKQGNLVVDEKITNIVVNRQRSLSKQKEDPPAKKRKESKDKLPRKETSKTKEQPKQRPQTTHKVLSDKE